LTITTLTGSCYFTHVASSAIKSLLRGEPNSQKIALTVLGDRIRELV
jgi:hypothetical protein